MAAVCPSKVLRCKDNAKTLKGLKQGSDRICFTIYRTAWAGWARRGRSDRSTAYGTRHICEVSAWRSNSKGHSKERAVQPTLQDLPCPQTAHLAHFFSHPQGNRVSIQGRAGWSQLDRAQAWPVNSKGNSLFFPLTCLMGADQRSEHI